MAVTAVARIEPIEQYVHGHDMRLALWCAWTNGGLSAHPHALSVRGPGNRAHWFQADYAPDWKPGPFYGGRLCLGSRDALEWAIQKTQWLVAHHKLDYLKHDIGPIVTTCNRQSHRHHYGADVSYWATMGYYEVQEKLRQAHPQLLLENCSGGGHIKDFGVIARTHYTVTTDTLSNLPDRQSLYDSTFAFPPVVLQAYTYDSYYPVRGDNPGPFLWRSAMMGAWQIDPTNTARWTTEERDSARRAVEIYKQWIRPILWDARVHHILPRLDGAHWDGMFYWSPGRQRGMLFVFRPESKDGQKSVRLKGLEPTTEYWTWSEDGSVPAATGSGATLMDEGLAITLPGEYTSDLIYVQAASLGRPDALEPPSPFRLKPAKLTSDPFATSGVFSWEPSVGARSYRIDISQSPSFEQLVAHATVLNPAATFTELPANRELYWRVEAIAWGGKRGNELGTTKLTTPKLQELRGVVFASDMPWVKATAGAGNSVHRGKNYHGKPISIAGRRYPTGLWTHAFNDETPADVVFRLPVGKFTTFIADVGVEDSAGGGSVQFQVLANAQVKSQSPVMRLNAVHTFRVDIGGATEITLRVLNGGDGHNCDHAAWGLARFVEAGAVEPETDLGRAVDYGTRR